MFDKRLQLIIDAAYKGNAAFKKAQADLDKLERDAAKSGGGTRNALKSVGVAAGAVAVSIGAVAMAAKGAWDILGEGARLRTLSGNFDRLSVSIGTTADALMTDLKSATRGMVSEFDLIASASELMSLGLTKSHDQTVRMASVAGQLGWDMNHLRLELNNMTGLRLDTLGLELDKVKKKAKEFERAGMTAKEAWAEAIITLGEAKLNIIQLDDAEVAMRQFETAIKDAGDAFKVAFAAETTDELGDMAGGAEALGDSLKYAAEGAAELAAALMSGPLSSIAKVGASSELDALIQKYQEMGGTLSKDFYTKHIAALRTPALTTYDQIVAAIADVNAEIEKMEGQMGDVGTELRDANIDWNNWQSEVSSALMLSDKAFKEWLVTVGLSSSMTKEELAAMAIALQEMGGAAVLSAADTGQLVNANAALSDSLRLLGVDIANVSAAEMGYIKVTEGLIVVTQTAAEVADVSAQAMTTRYAYWVRATNERNRAAEEARAKTLEEAKAIGVYSGALSTATTAEQALADAHRRLADAFSAEIGAKLEEGLIDENGVVNIDNANKALYEQAKAAGATAAQLAMLGVATGQFTQEQAQAALKAAILQEKIRQMAIAVVAGDMGFADAAGSMEVLKQQIDSGALGEATAGVEGLAGAANSLAENGPYTADLLVEHEAAMTAIGETQAALNNLTGIYNVGINVGVNGTPLPERAAGGPVRANSPYLVGEVGPELFVPSTSGTIVPNHRLGGGPLNVTMTVTFNGPADAPAVQRAIRNGMNEFYTDIQREGVAW